MLLPLQVYWFDDRCGGRNRAQFCEGIFVPLKHLKVIELWGYYGSTLENELLMDLVKNAGVALERVVIGPQLHLLDIPVDNPKEAAALYRDRAKEQVERLLPKHVELVLP